MNVYIYMCIDKCCWVYVVNKNRKKGRMVERFNGEAAENGNVCRTGLNRLNRTIGFVLA